MVARVQESKWKYPMPLKANIQNWHTVIYASFYVLKQVVGLNPKSRDGEIILFFFVMGGTIKSYGIKNLCRPPQS